VAHERVVQRALFDAGLAGITISPAYGGQGLTPAHQDALNEELDGYEQPHRLQVPTIVPCAAVILEFGTEEQKLQHIPAILKGEEIWIQFLSEPSGGSDVAGALTSAVRDGDEWILNGSKVWSTGAWWSDWALCLARTNWDVPKHRGLSVFMMKIDQPGVAVHRIEMLNGSQEFCQEFLTDVRIPDTDRIGGIDDGWTVGTRWMMHERTADSSPLVTSTKTASRTGTDEGTLVEIAAGMGRLNDPIARDQIGEARALSLIRHHLGPRLGLGMATGKLNQQGSAIGRLYAGTLAIRLNTIAFELSGSTGGAWAEDDASSGRGNDYLMRQISALGGGTTEIARNVISERVLGMPREAAPDRSVAFRDVPRGGAARKRS
jgi:alkylation response protein AidB-like acyl-CoA dehydrogenase